MKLWKASWQSTENTHLSVPSFFCRWTVLDHCVSNLQFLNWFSNHVKRKRKKWVHFLITSVFGRFLFRFFKIAVVFLSWVWVSLLFFFIYLIMGSKAEEMIIKEKIGAPKKEKKLQNDVFTCIQNCASWDCFFHGSLVSIS